MKKLLQKNHSDFSHVMYATRSGRKTVLHLQNGTLLETFLPIKLLLMEAPAGMLESINKGVVIAPAYVAETDGLVYIMADGSRHKGRVHPRSIDQSTPAPTPSGNVPQWAQYAVLDDMPLAFCIIELVFDEKGRGLDFIFRYCNKEMEALEGKPISEMLNRSFYEVFENGDKKWLVAYADVALNGVKRVIESYSPEINANLRIYCYQPQPNFCACLLVKR